MKYRGLIAIAAVLLLSGCAGSAQDQLADACKAESTKAEHRGAAEAVDSVKAAVSDTTEPAGKTNSVTVTGTTTVTASGTTSVYNWTCYAQQSDGKNYAAIQSFTQQ